MCLRKGMSPEDIRAVTGHTTADMMMKYVKFDDESKREKMSILNENAQSGVETVFDHAITVTSVFGSDCLPVRPILKSSKAIPPLSMPTSSSSLTSEATSMPAPTTSNASPTDKLNEVLEIIMKGI